MYISLHGLIHFIIYSLGILIGVLLVIALINVIKITKLVNIVLTENIHNINNTMDLIPDIAKNVHEISITTNETLDTVKNTVDLLEATVEASVDTITRNSGSIAKFINIVNNVAKTILDFVFAFKK